MSFRPREITIAGAGLVGALLAILLARRGYRVAVFEGRPDLRKHRISAGRSINLALANRGIRPLELAGTLGRLRPTLLPMRGRMLHDERGDLTFLPYGQQSHEVIYSVSRSGLNALLLDAAEATGKVTVHFEERVEAVLLDAGCVRVSGARGPSPRDVPYELLIGADGAGSRVREALDAHYGVASVEEQLFHSYKELHIPPGKDGGFQMHPEALHIWPRGDSMLIALPNTDKSFTATLFLPDEGRGSFSELATPAAFETTFQREFPDALSLMPDATERFFENPTGKLTTVHCPHWTAMGHVLLIGDAAHAIVPFHGQGMNCGFEDAAELDRLLEAHGGDWEPVLPAYEAARKPNAEAIALMAQENYVEMRSSVRDPRFRFKKEIAFELERRHPDRFIPRYSMVMFHHLPYAEALRRGAIQSTLLDELGAERTEVSEVDFELADRLVRARLEVLSEEA